MKEFAHFKMIYFINSVSSINNKLFKMNFSLIIHHLNLSCISSYFVIIKFTAKKLFL